MIELRNFRLVIRGCHISHMNEQGEGQLYLAMEIAMLVLGIGFAVLALIGKFGPGII